MAIRPLVKNKQLKKRTKKFIRHQSDRYVKVKVTLCSQTLIVILVCKNCVNQEEVDILKTRKKSVISTIYCC